MWQGFPFLLLSALGWCVVLAADGPTSANTDGATNDDLEGAISYRVTVIGSGATSVQRLVPDAMRAYLFANPGLAGSFDPAGSNKAKLSLMANDVDFAVCDLTPTQADLAEISDLAAFPLAAQAVVPAFNIEGVEITNKIVLTPQVLVAMFLSNITHWDDQRIRALNPTIALPHKAFTLVVRSDPIGQNLIAATAFSKWSPQWAAMYGRMSAWNWADRPNLVKANGNGNFFDAFSNIPNALGLMWLDDAVDNGMHFAHMINSAGREVEPSARTVRFAMMESGVAEVQFDGGTVDITDARSLDAWPLAGYSYLVIRRFAFRETCTIKTEVIKLFSWFYTSLAAQRICERRGFVRLPDFVIEEHGILDSIHGQVFCADGLSLAATTAQLSHGIGSTIATDLLETALSVYQELFPGVPSNIDYQESDPDAALQRLRFGEVDFVMLTPRTMKQKTLIKAEPEVFTLPMFSMALVPIHGLATNDSDPSVALDMNTLARIWSGSILTWDHPAIASLNPVLAARGKLTGNITKVVVTSGQRQTTKFFIQALAEASDSFPHSTDGTDDKAYVFQDLKYFSGVKHVMRITTDSQMQTAVTTTPGAIGFALNDNRIRANTIDLVRGGKTLAPSIDTEHACLSDSFNSTTLRYSPFSSQDPSCWPITIVMYTAVMREHTGATCAGRLRGLRFLKWLHASPDDASVGDVGSAIGLHMVPFETRQLVSAALNAVTCDGETMLITLPVPTRISPTVAVVSDALGGFGITLCAMAIGFIWVFHRRTAVRSSSPVFLFVMVLGIAMLFTSGIFFSTTVPTDSDCGSAFWLLSLGFYLTFAPLFAKSWRIYKIFMRTQMSVLKITDTTLFARLAGVLALELALLVIIHLVDPVIARTDVISALPRDQLVTYCSPSQPVLVGALGAMKAVLLVFGTIMSFTTRGVSDNFNESKIIAFSIYNVTFTTIIVMLIALLQSGILSIMQLIVFTIHWIALCTFLINFLPKVLTVWKNAIGFIPDVITNSKLGTNNSGSAKKSGQTTGVLRSLKDFINTTIRMLDRNALRTYIGLMEKELTAAKAALATLNANEGALYGSHGMHGAAAAPASGMNNSVHDNNDLPIPGRNSGSNASPAGTGLRMIVRRPSQDGTPAPSSASGFGPRPPMAFRQGSTTNMTAAATNRGSPVVGGASGKIVPIQPTRSTSTPETKYALSSSKPGSPTTSGGGLPSGAAQQHQSSSRVPMQAIPAGGTRAALPVSSSQPAVGTAFAASAAGGTSKPAAAAAPTAATSGTNTSVSATPATAAGAFPDTSAEPLTKRTSPRVVLTPLTATPGAAAATAAAAAAASPTRTGGAPAPSLFATATVAAVPAKPAAVLVASASAAAAEPSSASVHA